MKKIVVIGAGISGLSAAFRLAENGFTDIKILEGSKNVGGLARSLEKEGFIFDLGPHQIHTQDIKVINFLKYILKEDFIVKKKRASQYFLNKRFNYPLGLNDVILGLPPHISLQCFASFLFHKIKSKFFRPKQESFKSWVIENFGKKMYDIYFGPYTTKVWGKDPSELSASCAKERIAVQSLWDVFLSAILRNSSRFRNSHLLPHSPYQKVYYYPRKGIGQLASMMNEFLEQQNIFIELNQMVNKICRNSDNTFSVFTDSGTCHFADYVITTIPISITKNILSYDAPSSLVKPTEDLEYRSLTFIYLLLKKDMVTDDHWIYFSDKNCIYQRSSEFKNFSAETCPDGKTSICMEIPCTYNDEVWNMSQEELFDRVMDQAEKDGFLKREWILGYHCIRERYVYPILGVGHEELVRQTKEYVNSCPGLYSIGRQGQFQYVNIDNVLIMGFDAADSIIKRTTNKTPKSEYDDANYMMQFKEKDLIFKEL
jgi:protoporphyrinogen oxidase